MLEEEAGAALLELLPRAQDQKEHGQNQ
jgi:hypothetical protein